MRLVHGWYSQSLTAKDAEDAKRKTKLVCHEGHEGTRRTPWSSARLDALCASAFTWLASLEKLNRISRSGLV